MFEKNNVLYQYPVNHGRLLIGKFCSIACGARFLFNSANHTMRSLSTILSRFSFEEWGLDQETWQRPGTIKETSSSAMMSGSAMSRHPLRRSHRGRRHHRRPGSGHSGCGAYTIMGGVPARPIRKRYDEETIQRLLALRWWTSRRNRCENVWTLGARRPPGFGADGGRIKRMGGTPWCASRMVS